MGIFTWNLQRSYLLGASKFFVIMPPQRMRFADTSVIVFNVVGKVLGCHRKWCSICFCTFITQIYLYSVLLRQCASLSTVESSDCYPTIRCQFAGPVDKEYKALVEISGALSVWQSGVKMEFMVNAMPRPFVNMVLLVYGTTIKDFVAPGPRMRPENCFMTWTCVCAATLRRWESLCLWSKGSASKFSLVTRVVRGERPEER